MLCKNKKQISKELLPDKETAATHSEFYFKTVILLSTMHSDNKIDSESGKLKKLEIITL